MFVAIAGLTFASCSEENNAPSYDPNGVEVANAELKTKLQALGYSFNEKGNLLQDEKVQKTTSLDLSNANLTSAKGLDVFPNLTEVKLSNNKFEKSFDFTQLPDKVTSVDLTNNEIYEFPGLVDVKTEENGDETVTVLRKFTKLDLPETAKYNCDEIPTYFAKAQGVDLQMEDASGKLAVYTTLRDVPDPTVLSILKKTFPSMFNGDKIDISKRLVDPSQKISNIVINPLFMEEGTNIKSVEGFEYIVMNKGFEGTLINIATTQDSRIPYLKLNSKIVSLMIKNISSPISFEGDVIDLTYLEVTNNRELYNVDLSKSQNFGQRSKDIELSAFKNPSKLTLVNCPNCESLTFPQKAKMANTIKICNLPKLKKLDLSQFSALTIFYLGGVSEADIVYPNLVDFPSGGKTTFGITKEIYDLSTTKTFIDKYKDHLVNGYRMPDGSELTIYDWTK